MPRREWHLDGYKPHAGGSVFFLVPVVLVGSVGIGFGASLLWNGQGALIAELADDTNRGLYSGTFLSVYMSNLVVGSLLGLFALPSSIDSDQIQRFYTILACPAALGSLMLLMLLAPVGKLAVAANMAPLNPPDDVPDDAGASEVAGTAPAPTAPAPVLDSLWVTLRWLFRREVVRLWPLFAYAGVSLAMWTGKYSAMMGGTLSPGTLSSLPGLFYI